MLNFILYNDTFIKILIYLFGINIFLTLFAERKSNKNKIRKKEEINKENTFKNKTIDFYILLITIILLFVFFKEKNVYSFCIFLMIISSYFKAFKNYTQDSLTLNFEIKKNYICVSAFFTILFSSKACSIYINSFNNLPHEFKEILLLVYLISKIIFVIFFILINTSIIISNMQLLFEKKLNTLLNKISNINFIYNPIYYNFYFSNNENKKLLICIDKIIFFITCPIYMIFNIIYKLLFSATIKIISILIKLYKFLLNFNNNRNLIIKKILKISTIVSSILVYICTIYNHNIFSIEIKDIYNLLITVLLIPIVYDSIKTKEFK